MTEEKNIVITVKRRGKKGRWEMAGTTTLEDLRMSIPFTMEATTMPKDPTWFQQIFSPRKVRQYYNDLSKFYVNYGMSLERQKIFDALKSLKRKKK